MFTAGTALVFFAFAVIRAIRVPMTYDEAAAYLRYVSADPLSVFNFAVATNHLLHTLLTRLAHALGGDSEVVLRLPSLVGYAMYLWFSILLLRRPTHRFVAFAGFLLLNLNLYVLDYFALSRGYGLSLGFLMGSLHFLLAFLDHPDTTQASPRLHLSRALVMTTGAVLANFALLNVYLAILVVVLVTLVASKPAGSGGAVLPDADRRTAVPGGWKYLFAVATLFTVLVFSQDVELSERLYEPVTVTIAGLERHELEQVRVSRIDLRGRSMPLPRQGSVWRLDGPVHFRGLRIELPARDAGERQLLEVLIGSRIFTSSGRSAGLWNSYQAGGMQVLESGAQLSLRPSKVPAFQPIINWAGEPRYVRELAMRTAEALLMLGTLGLLLAGLGTIAGRAGFLRRDQWLPVASSVLWVAALAGSPLYLLHRSGELFYGGSEGLVRDTFRSILDGSFYGRIYHDAQIDIGLGAAAFTVLAFVLLLASGYRRGTLRTLTAPAALMAVIALVSLAVVVQHLLFETPYLLGRTAIFYIPLFTVFLVLISDRVAGTGRVARSLVVSVFVGAVTASAYHFATAANTTSTWDWPDDASTREMLADLEHAVITSGHDGERVRLGVAPIYFPVAVFYSRQSAVPIDVDVVPAARPTHFVYVQDRHRTSSTQVIREYPLTRSVLARGEPIR